MSNYKKSNTKTWIAIIGILLAFDNVVLMQYTGLKDKNGKEIYEGDIINIVEGNLNGIYEIEMKYGCWGFEANRRGVEMDFIKIGYWIRSNNDTNVLSQVEIINNIYEI